MHRTLDVRSERRPAARLRRFRAALDDRRHAYRPPPIVESIENVRFTEFDANRPSPGAFRVVPLEVPVDASEGDFQRNATVGPSAHLLEGRPYDPDEMPVILLTKVGFDIATKLRRVSHFDSDDSI